jgi:hypothetical protein
MRAFLYGFVAIAALLGGRDASADIFRCEDPEGGLVYQGTPCPEPAPQAAGDDAGNNADAVEPAPPEQRRVARDESVEERVAAIEEQDRRHEEVEACKQQYRDAIDAIDLEIRDSYSPEQKDYYLGRLKALTDKMSEC